MGKKKTIFVSGKNGQLGSELLALSMSYPQFHWVFADRNTLDLSSVESINAAFEKFPPDYFINCAAYTAVDKAEMEKELATQINATAVGRIAENCAKIGAILIHFSTDYVFDGKGKLPYLTSDDVHPVNFYGKTKWEGEQLALRKNPKTIVIRTSWVYSIYGKNFVKTMLRLMTTREEISVVNDQLGTPTYARDLAVAVMDIITAKEPHYGVYHFSNSGIISWFDFAVAIKEIAKLNCIIHAIPSSQFPTPAKRPGYSVLDKSKIVQDYSVHLRDWKDSLKACLQYMQRWV